jgi:hypothetical protein
MSTPVIPTPTTGKDKRTCRERLERRLWRAWKQLRHHLGGKTQRQYVFVAGMQRSGTNMLMEILEWSAHTDVYHESDARAFERYELRPRPVLHDLAEHSAAPFFVIKSLCELDLLGELMAEFPPAKTLWIVRAYDDSVSSAIRSFGNFAVQLHRLALDKNGNNWRGRGMSDETQAILARCDHPQINEASAAALMWYYRNILFFEQGLDRNPNVKLVFYEGLVTEPRHTLRDIFTFLGLPGWSPWLSRYIHAGSVKKLPRKDIEPAVRAVCDELSSRFARQARSTTPRKEIGT